MKSRFLSCWKDGSTGRVLVARDWALLPLRLVIGFGFAAHGYAKLSRGPEHFAEILSAIGVPWPHFSAWATALLELGGGTCVMLGAFVGPLSIPLMAIMLTAMLRVHFQYGFSSIRLQAVTASGAVFGPVGYEINLLYIAGLAALALGGGGELSIGSYRSRKRRRAPEVREPGDSTRQD